MNSLSFLQKLTFLIKKHNVIPTYKEYIVHILLNPDASVLEALEEKVHLVYWFNKSYSYSYLTGTLYRQIAHRPIIHDLPISKNNNIYLFSEKNLGYYECEQIQLISTFFPKK